MLKPQYLVEQAVIYLRYIASNTSLMMSLSIGYPQKLANPGSKFTIRFSPSYNKVTFYMKYHHTY